MVESLLGVDPTQSYGENTKSPIQNFIDFAMKTHWIDFFHKFITSICYFYILLFDSLISLWFWIETARTNLEKKLQFSMGFYSRIYDILDKAFCIIPITLGRVDPQQWFDHQNITNWRLYEYLIFFQTNFGGFRRKLEKTRGVTFFSTGSHVEKWKKSLFSMMWLYPVLFSINSRLQKCNLFACTPRMNNSRLSKHTNWKCTWVLSGLCYSFKTYVVWIIPS